MEETGDTDLSIPPERGDFTQRHKNFLHYFAFYYHGQVPGTHAELRKDIITALNEECPPPKSDVV
jgi:hypothetical protein